MYIDKSDAMAMLGVGERALSDVVRKYGVEVKAGYVRCYNAAHIRAAKFDRAHGGNTNAQKKASARALKNQNIKELKEKEEKEEKERAASRAALSKAHALALKGARSKSTGIAAALKSAAREHASYKRGDEIAFSLREDLAILCDTLFLSVQANGTTCHTDKGALQAHPDLNSYLKAAQLCLNADKALAIGAGNRGLKEVDDSPKDAILGVINDE